MTRYQPYDCYDCNWCSALIEDKQQQQQQQQWMVCSPSSVYNSTIRSRHSCASCTGYAFLKASSSVWPLLCSVTRPHLNNSRDFAVGWWRHLSKSTTIRDNSQDGCASHTTPNNRWSCVRCCRTSSVEQFAYWRHHLTVRRYLQTAFENHPVHTIVWRLTSCYICCYLSSKPRFTAG